MAKESIWTCKNCGHTHHKWVGKCDNCNTFQSVVQEQRSSLPKNLSGGDGGKSLSLVNLSGNTTSTESIKTEINEFDRVCGGGLISGSAILVGGDPGIGKSTLLIQICGALSNKKKCIYISGEEAIDQIRLRAKRLGLEKTKVKLATETNVRDITKTLDEVDSSNLVVIDSIQTMYNDSINSPPGTVTQVRACAQELIRIAKKRGFVIFLIGHVTKDGTIAGPRVLEHIVDTVLYFEGDRGHQFRILRVVKNRFGATDEIGVFEMSEKGLHEVSNPSALFLADRRGKISGNCVFAGIEGTRPLLMEIQALVSPCNSGQPRRNVVGLDSNRLSMITAVLESRCGLELGRQDIFLNVAGGLKITEPAADAAVATALISAFRNRPAPSNAVMFSEIGLSGEMRSVPQMEQRIKEASKLGFNEAWVPKQTKPSKTELENYFGLSIKAMGHIQDLVKEFD